MSSAGRVIGAQRVCRKGALHREQHLPVLRQRPHGIRHAELDPVAVLADTGEATDPVSRQERCLLFDVVAQLCRAVDGLVERGTRIELVALGDAVAKLRLVPEEEYAAAAAFFG
jgi:hypothetical protein